MTKKDAIAFCKVAVPFLRISAKMKKEETDAQFFDAIEIVTELAEKYIASKLAEKTMNDIQKGLKK